MVASLHFVHQRHDLKTLGPEDQVQEIKNQQDVDPLPNDEFRAGMVELARDLITKEQEIEALASALPGLDNSEQDQHKSIKALQEELKYETEASQSVPETPEFLKAFQQQGVWQVSFQSNRQTVGAHKNG